MNVNAYSRKRAQSATIKRGYTKRGRSDIVIRKNFQRNYPESKIIYTSGSLDHSGGAVQDSCINPLVEGTGDDQMIGQQIRIKTLQLRYYSASGVYPYRVMVVVDRESHGTDLDEAKLFSSTTSVLTMRNHTYSKRFRVLFDDFVKPDNDNGGIGNKYLKVNIPVQYNAGTHVSSYDNIENGSMWIVSICENTSAQVHWHSQIKYIDN